MLDKLDSKITFIKNIIDDDMSEEDKDFALHQILNITIQMEDIVGDLKNIRDSL